MSFALSAYPSRASGLFYTVRLDADECYNFYMHNTYLLRTALMLIVILVFMTTGILKLMSSPQEVAVFVAWGYPLWLMYLTGMLNIIFAIGLCVKKVSHISTIFLMALLATAIISNLLDHQPHLMSVPAFILFSALAYVLYIDKYINKSSN